MSKTIVAFGETGAFFTYKRGGTPFSRGLPSRLKEIVDGEGRTFFWVSLGPGGQFYVSWSRRDGTEKFELGDTTGDYEGLYTKLNAAKRNSGNSVSKIKVIFGPKKGSWFLTTGTGSWQPNRLASSRVTEAIDDSEEGVKHIALGLSDSWVVMFRDETVKYELRGKYGGLKNILDDAGDGDIKAVFLDPFSLEGRFVAGLTTGEKKGNIPTDLLDQVQF